jgi:hypothetical protein
MTNGKIQRIDLCTVIQSPTTDQILEIANTQQASAGNDNPKKAQGHQQW